MEVHPREETERELLERIAAAAIAKGRATTGVFGVRQQQPSFAYLCEKLAILHPEATSDLQRLECTFGRMKFIHLFRQDKLAQAVSYLKAEQSGLWHVAADGSELERTGAAREPEYNALKIRECVEIMAACDQGWREWFDREGIDPISISYDELSREPVETVRMLLGELGLDRQAADGIEPGVRKMADATSQNWIERYRSEHA